MQYDCCASSTISYEILSLPTTNENFPFNVWVYFVVDVALISTQTVSPTLSVVFGVNIKLK